MFKREHSMHSGAAHSAPDPCPTVMLSTKSWDCARELTLAEKLALQHSRTRAAVPAKNVHPAPEASEEAEQDPQTRRATATSSLARLSLVLQDREVLEASLGRVRLQRALRGAKKLQSSLDGPVTATGGHLGR